MPPYRAKSEREGRPARVRDSSSGGAPRDRPTGLALPGATKRSDPLGGGDEPSWLAVAGSVHDLTGRLRRGRCPEPQPVNARRRAS